MKLNDKSIQNKNYITVDWGSTILLEIKTEFTYPQNWVWFKQWLESKIIVLQFITCYIQTYFTFYDSK